MVLVGMSLWAVCFGLWNLSGHVSVALRLGILVLILLVYQVGFFFVVVGMGIDNWDDSSRLYWDTYLLWGSTIGLGVLYTVLKFNGALRGAVLVFQSLVYAAMAGWLCMHVLRYP